MGTAWKGGWNGRGTWRNGEGNGGVRGKNKEDWGGNWERGGW